MERILVEVCAGTHCVMMGSMNIIDAVHSLEEFREEMGTPCKIEVKAIPCMNLCKEDSLGESNQGPFVKVNGRMIEHAESDGVMAEIMKVCKEA